MTADESGAVGAVPEEPESSGVGEAKQRADMATLPAVVEAMQARFDEAIQGHRIVSGDQQVVFVAPEANLEVLEWLKTEAEWYFDFLADVTAVDFGGGRPLQVVYQLWSLPHRRALRLKCELPLDGLRIRSVVPLWQAANWLEREVFDLFGIHFEGHPDLRRILMPDDYEEGHPLRKDFPLRGHFSRAEQTRRALARDVDEHYTAFEMEVGGEPQLVESAGAGDEGTDPEEESE